MLNKLHIGENTFLTHCTVKGATNEINFTLYDFQGSWNEQISICDMLKRVKALNKRIQIDKTAICNTLQRAEPVELTFEEDDGLQNKLKLKYRLGACPFKFEWHLQKHSGVEELQTLLPALLFRTVKGMTQQVEELRQVVQKKDIEIQQYKREGAVLRITTVATKPFDFSQFDEKFTETNDFSKGFQNVGDFLEEHFSKRDSEKDFKHVEKQTEMVVRRNTRNQKQEVSPRNRKRRALEMQQQRLEAKLNVRKKKLEYESSQSLSQEIETKKDCEKLDDVNKTMEEETTADQPTTSKNSMTPNTRNGNKTTEKSLSSIPECKRRINLRNRNNVQRKFGKQFVCENGEPACEENEPLIVKSQSLLQSEILKENSDKSDNNDEDDLTKQLKAIEKVFENLQSNK